MADYTEIIQEINTNLPDNNTQSITAEKLRTTLTDMLGAIDDAQEEFEGDINETLSTFVEDTLYSTDTDKALSANQGYNLAADRSKIIVEGANETLIRQSRIPVIPGHTYRLTLSNTELTMSNISLGDTYSRLYVFISDGRTTSETTSSQVLVKIPISGTLSYEYELVVPNVIEGEPEYRWIEIQSRFDAGQTLVYFLDDITESKILEDKINPQILRYSKKDITRMTEEVSNKFPVCQFTSSNNGLFKNYAIGKSWNTLLESGTNSSHKTYRIPVDPEKYVMCSIQLYGSSTAQESAPLACLVDENDKVVSCITNNFGNGGYWTGNIIPKNAKYLIMPVWTASSYIVNVAFIPKTNFVSQNEEKSYSSIASTASLNFNMFGKDNPVFGGGKQLDSVSVYGRYGNLDKYTVNDLLSSYFGSSTSLHTYKLLYVEGYDEIEFRGFDTTSYPGFYFTIDRNGNIIDYINNKYYYINKYQLPSNACFFALRGADSAYEAVPNIILRKKSLKPLELPTFPLNGIGLTPGKLGENGELNNLSDNELYWTTSYIDLSKGFTLETNPEFVIVKAVLYKTDTTVVNPYFIEESYNTGSFWSIANPISGYMVRITIGIKDLTVNSKPITKYDSVIKTFTYLDNPDLTKVIPTDKPYEAFKNRLYKLTNISEISRFDQWMDHFDKWNNNSQSIPMSSNDGEPKYWNSRFREGWTEFGTPYSEASEYGYYVGQNISLKTYITAIQNKRSVMYFERINGSTVNSTTIGSKISKYNYSYNGLNSHYASTFYGTVCTGLTGYLMGQRNLYVSGDYMRRNAANNGPRVPNLSAPYTKYYSDTITQSQWDEMIDWLQPMDFIWTPGHCSVVSDIYKDYNGKTQLIVWSEEVRPFTKSRAYTRDRFQNRLQNILDNGSGNGFGLLRYNDWENADLTDYYNDDKYFATNNWNFKSNIQIDPDITTFRGEYVTFQVGSNDGLNDYNAYLNIHRGRNLYNYLQIFNEDDTELTTPIKQIGISASETFPSDTLYPEDAYDKEDWIIFDLNNVDNMNGVLSAGRYKARLYNSNDNTTSGFTHFEYVDFSFNATLDGTSIKASWSNFSENAAPYLIRQERITGMAFTEGSEYPSSQENRSGQTYIYNVNSPTVNNETVYTLTTDGSWGSNYYTKIYVRGTYGTVCRRIKTIN